MGFSADLLGETTAPAPLTAAERMQAEVLAHYSQGLIHDIHREFDAALTNYMQAVALDPANEPLTFRVAMSLLRRERVDEAVQLMEQLREQNPESARVLQYLALVYRASNRNDDAAEVYDDLLELRGLAAEAYVDAANFFLSLEERDRAVAALRRGVERAEDPFTLTRSLARLLTDRARTAEDEKDRARAMDEAIDLYRAVAEESPDDMEALSQLGSLYILKGRTGEAVELFQRIEAANPEDLQIKQRLAANFLAAGDVDEAIAQLEAISRRQPANAQIYYYLGELYQNKGDLENAVLNFSLATRAGDSPAPVIRLALLLIEDDPDEAVTLLREALESRPLHPRFNSLLAYALLRGGHDEEALQAFAEAELTLDEEAGNGPFYYNYGLACFRTGRQEQAAEYLLGALDDNLGYLDALLQDLIRSGPDDLDRAIRLMETLAGRRTEPAPVLVYLGMLQSYAERYDAALETLASAEEAASATPLGRLLLNPEFYFHYAAAAERSRQYERAESLFQKTLDLDPSHTHALNYLAYMWAERGVNLDEATEKVKAALALEPENGAFIDTLGWIRYKQGRYEEALEEVMRAAELEPDDETIAAHLGDIYEKLGREEEAVLHWQRSLLLDPENEEIREKLEARGVDLKPLLEQAEERRRTLMEQGVDGPSPEPQPDPSGD